jgi:hypothetical protein
MQHFFSTNVSYCSWPQAIISSLLYSTFKTRCPCPLFTLSTFHPCYCPPLSHFIPVGIFTFVTFSPLVHMCTLSTFHPLSLFNISSPVIVFTLATFHYSHCSTWPYFPWQDFTLVTFHLCNLFPLVKSQPCHCSLLLHSTPANFHFRPFHTSPLKFFTQAACYPAVVCRCQCSPQQSHTYPL